ncbi:MAG: efflux RND transporter periplasmic adaptor subunit [Anaerolineaceae bacterium]|nr:efflux RND transporter periplasmic adaptor subunit [Anaerolineaceae bacterium]
MKIFKFIILSFFTIAIVATAGYLGFQNSAPEQETTVPPPQTLSVSTCDVVQTINAPGKLINFDATIINMPVDGKITDVLVKPGDEVRAGQTLANLDDMAKKEANLKLLEAKEALETAQKHRQALDYPRATDDYMHKLEDEIEIQRQNVILLEDVYDNATMTADKSQALTNLSNGKQNLTEMQARLNWYKGKPTQNDLDQADSQLALAQAQYDAAMNAIVNYEITSPINGIVVAVTAVTGEQFKENQNLFKIINPLSLEVQANISEDDYPFIHTGMFATIYLDARPELTLSGDVERIVPMRISESSALYNIYIKLDNVPDGLADGMTIDASITLDERKHVLCLPRALVRSTGGTSVIIQTWNGNEVVKKEVQTGLFGDSNVEILSGIEENEQVIIR